jgi:hypothetical protein
MSTTQFLFTSLGGRHRFYRLRAVYKKAKPHRGRWGPCILTADEVFRQRAKDDGFSDGEIAMFIDHADL